MLAFCSIWNRKTGKWRGGGGDMQHFIWGWFPFDHVPPTYEPSVAGNFLFIKGIKVRVQGMCGL